MDVMHNSHSLKYRNPFGAIVKDSAITLSLDICPPPQEVKLHFIYDGENEKTALPLSTEDSRENTRYTWEITADKVGLIWYYFSFRYNNSPTQYYGNAYDSLGGMGAVYANIPPSFQITVYKESALCENYKSGVIYQIFPDRFKRGEDYKERLFSLMRDENREGARRIYHLDWNDKPFYPKNELGHVTRWGFFGGTFQGIEEKLMYLKSLGITTLYLNPIFEGASNHKYDTANYKKADRGFGDEESFLSLVNSAKELGIDIMLDGVFSHTGADSIYFNKFSTHDSIGAVMGESSPYYSWYRFEKFPDKYECWWGVEDLPNVNEDDASYRKYLFEEDGVIAYWMKLGVKGWRLDVADELPDSFIEELRQAVKREDENGIVLGEVWEDASNKISYGNRRRYLYGDELDCTMNYPFKDALLRFAGYTHSAQTFGRIMMSLKENYPPSAFYGAMNMLSTHDTERIITVLGKVGNPKEDITLTQEQYNSAKQKLKMLFAVLFTSPGVPCIYYGDEVGVQGMRDPYNRATYPWGREDKEILEHVRNLSHIRKIYPVLVEGDYEPCSTQDDVYSYVRSGAYEKMYVLANRSGEKKQSKIKLDKELNKLYILDIINVKPYKAPQDENSDNTEISIELQPYGFAIMYVRDKSENKSNIAKGAGVLCHLSSLPEHEEGLLGAAKCFVDKLERAKQTYWQILPLCPTDMLGSPYASSSVFAGEDNLLYKADILRGESALCMSKYRSFCEENAFWVEDYALYSVLKDKNSGKALHEWGEELKSPKAKLRQLYKAETEQIKKRQYIFFNTWAEIKSYANAKGVKIIGDMPIYVSADSSDVWANPTQFTVDENYIPTASAGVPPDYFSEEGQSWGNPLYNVENMKKDGYSWWKKRFELDLKRYDAIRLDHFRSFAGYFVIPKGKKPKDGYWERGMGKDFFDIMRKELGELPIIAEDLGFIDASVLDLLEYTAFPGMDIYQFTADKMRAMDSDEAKERIFYTGTHDNQTLKSFLGEIATEKDVRKIIEELYATACRVIILPMQDILAKDDKARMNTPGTTTNNWKWKMVKEDFKKEHIDFLSNLSENYNRI